MEEFRDIEGYEGLYQVSNLGRVKSLKRIVLRGDKKNELKEKILKGILVNNYYLRVDLYKNSCKKSFYLHRLLAIAFIENIQNKLYVNHKNGVKLDNRLVNLEWCTQEENIKHANITGLIPRGVQGVDAKLTEEQVKYIKYNSEGINQPTLARMFGVNQSIIHCIRKNKTWKHI